MTFDSWDQCWMTQAFSFAQKSKDPSTQCGCVIVGPDNDFISMGFNGLPRGIKDTPERFVAPLKYDLMIHAEVNAIVNVARGGKAGLVGSRMYSPVSPCHRCAGEIIQAGISEIIVSIYSDQILDRQKRKWDDSLKLARELFEEAGINIRIYPGHILKEITNLSSGKPIIF